VAHYQNASAISFARGHDVREFRELRPALGASSARVYQSRPPLRDAAKLGSHPFMCQAFAYVLSKFSFSRFLVKELASAEFLDLLGRCPLTHAANWNARQFINRQMSGSEVEFGLANAVSECRPMR
jgi:hypothetical protein